MKVAISDALYLDEETLQTLEALNYDVVRYDAKSVYTEPTDVIVGMRMDKEKVSEGLKFVQLLSAGFDSINLDLFKDHGVALANGRGMYSIPIAEYCLAHILSIYNTLPGYRNLQEKKEWTKLNQSRSLDGSKVLVLGTGSIAQETAKRLKGFNVTVDGTNSNGRAIEHFDTCFSLSELDQLLGNYDIVLNTLPHNDATHHIMDAKQFSLMKNDSIFLNIGRGATVNLDGLLEVLDHNLSAVVLDVFENEPLDASHPIWNHPKAVVTPHASFETDRLNMYRLRIVMDNLTRFAKGNELINRII